MLNDVGMLWPICHAALPVEIAMSRRMPGMRDPDGTGNAARDENAGHVHGHHE